MVAQNNYSRKKLDGGGDTYVHTDVARRRKDQSHVAQNFPSFFHPTRQQHGRQHRVYDEKDGEFLRSLLARESGRVVGSYHTT